MSGGLVGIIANDSARYSLFASCVTSLRTPEGSKTQWVIGGDWCAARNSLARQTIEEERDWLWFMDDDHAFPPNLLERLLAHDLPLVTPMCLTRTYPFSTVSFIANPDGDGRWLPLPLSTFPHEGLVELEAGGCAGMLIRREVLEAVEPPWFEYTHQSEDIIFCNKARAAGFPLVGDLEARLGHITTCVVSPGIKDDRWVTVMTLGRDMNLFVEPAEILLANEPPDETETDG